MSALSRAAGSPKISAGEQGEQSWVGSGVICSPCSELSSLSCLGRAGIRLSQLSSAPWGSEVDAVFEGRSVSTVRERC